MSAPHNSINGPIGREYFQVLSSNFTGTNVNTAQPVFNATANGAFNAIAATSYFFEAVYYITRAAGTTSHTLSTLFGGTASITSIAYMAHSTSTTGNVLGALSRIYGTAASALVVTAASIIATENITITLKGIVRINAAGTFIPQIQYSAAPGGVPTFLANSYFRLYPIGSNVVTSIGNWT